MTERLQKALANLGLGSRREIEKWISAGRITINGQVAQLGAQINGDETLLLDGKPIYLSKKHPFKRRVIIYFKPVGQITSRMDPQGRESVFDHLPKRIDGRWIAVGRLDLNTQGLLIFTNDGELANRLMHPSQQIEREYAVRILGTVAPEVIERLKEGVMLEDGLAKFDEIHEAGGEGANHWYHVVLREGKNREVRRLWDSQGLTVSRLIRIRYGNISLPRGLKPGQIEEVQDEDLNALLALAGLEEQNKPVLKSEKQPKTFEQPQKISRNTNTRKNHKTSSKFNAQKNLFNKDNELYTTQKSFKRSEKTFQSSKRQKK